MSSPILHRLALALQLPILMLDRLALAFHRLTFRFQRPHLGLSLCKGTPQRVEILPVHATVSRRTHARSLSRKARCNGYTYTAFTGTSIVPYRSPRLRPCVRPTSTQLLAA